MLNQQMLSIQSPRELGLIGAGAALTAGVVTTVAWFQHRRGNLLFLPYDLQRARRDALMQRCCYCEIAVLADPAPSGALMLRNDVLWPLADRGQPLAETLLVQIALQVSGAALRMLETGGIRCTLAAQNVRVLLLDDGDPHALVVHIGDCGDGCAMGSAVLRWMAPEMIRRREVSEKADVFAYGVLLWELWSHGEYPWQVVVDDAAVAQRIVNDKRLDRPVGCPQQAYDMMQRCWKADPSARPSFSELHAELSAWAAGS